MSKYIKPWRPLLFAQLNPLLSLLDMDTAQPSELAYLPQELQSHNEAQDLLLLQDYVCKLLHTQRTREDTYALLQQTELLAGVINEQDCRAISTACCCLKSLRIRVEARANVTERAVISRQLQLMQASIQHYPRENLNTADTSCRSRILLNTSIPDLVPVQRMNARIPVPMWLSQQPWSTASNAIDCNPDACARNLC